MKPRYLVGMIALGLLLYPLSYGPAMRLAFFLYPHHPTIPPMMNVYRPLLDVPVLSEILVRYANACMPSLESTISN